MLIDKQKIAGHESHNQNYQFIIFHFVYFCLMLIHYFALITIIRDLIVDLLLT